MKKRPASERILVPVAPVTTGVGRVLWCTFLPATCWPHRPSSALGSADGLVEETIPQVKTCSDF